GPTRDVRELGKLINVLAQPIGSHSNSDQDDTDDRSDAETREQRDDNPRRPRDHQRIRKEGGKDFPVHDGQVSRVWTMSRAWRRNWWKCPWPPEAVSLSAAWPSLGDGRGSFHFGCGGRVFFPFDTIEVETSVGEVAHGALGASPAKVGQSEVAERQVFDSVCGLRGDPSARLGEGARTQETTHGPRRAD